MAKVIEGKEKKKVVMVTMDTTEAEVLQFNADREVVLKFDPVSFKKLPESIVKELRYENQRNYHIAYGAQDQVRFKAPNPPMDLSSPLEMGRESVLKIRERKGYHQCWIMGTLVNGNSGEVEMYKEVGYVPVRRNKEGEHKEPGEENGEIIRMHDFGKSELVAMEVPSALYNKHLEAMSAKSASKYKALKEQFAEKVEETNAQRPRRMAAVVVDDEGDI